MRETFTQSLWSALSPPAPEFATLAGDVSADVAVIGGGLLGLSTALHLAEQGCRTVLIEAAETGFGASGRNTGFVVPSLRTGLGPSDVRALVGETGDRLMALVGASGNLVFDLIARLGIDCSAEQTGWMQPAHTAAMLDVLRQRQLDWHALGRTVEILDAAETAARIGAAGYHGALFDPTGGQINPLAYVRGLARAAQAAGAALYVRSPVVGIGTQHGRPVARTAHGQVTADRILLATNALVDGLSPSVARSIIPVRVFQIATEPLPAELRRTILPQRTPVADTRHHTFAVRWSPDGRLITGGLVLPGPGRFERATTIFRRRLARMFPAIGAPAADYVWTGVIAATTDAMPRFMSVAPGVDAAIGCNGRGVALTTALGREIAALYAGRLEPAAFPLPHGAPIGIPAHGIAQLGPMLWLPWSNLRDRIDSGRVL
ncbi:MAG: FAD-binding oxidoreductase [Ancalomicrobiaceae bacterium]|nr:FAD-binding oxidoreductase [Ancalomicrobiaceae bacterium]